MVDLAQCQDYLTVAGEGFDIAFQLFLGVGLMIALMWFVYGILDRTQFMPTSPTLAELERRHKFLGIIIERKKKALLKKNGN